MGGSCWPGPGIFLSLKKSGIAGLGLVVNLGPSTILDGISYSPGPGCLTLGVKNRCDLLTDHYGSCNVLPVFEGRVGL